MYATFSCFPNKAVNNGHLQYTNKNNNNNQIPIYVQ